MDDPKDKFPDEDVGKIVQFIRQRRGVDLSPYRRNFVYRHLRSRLVDTQSASYLEYIRCLKENNGEIHQLLDRLSINVTSFFRDQDVFGAFREQVVPELLKKKSAHKGTIRIWSAACASGQEPYSLAIMMCEETGDTGGVRIWATDVDKDALDKAKAGCYTEGDLKGITDRRLIEKYFDRRAMAYTVKPELRALVRFERHNLIEDDPLRYMDVIFCRNVMIYFTHDQQNALLAKFAQALNMNGYLVISKVESVRERSLFAPVDYIRKIYRKVQ